MTVPQYMFGSGTAWCTPLTDYLGNAIANPTPFLIAGVQDISIGFSADQKALYGTNAFALAIARGKQKIDIKIKNAQINGRIWNSLFFGQLANQSVGIYDMVFDQVGTVLAGTSLTPTVPGSGTWGYDLGVRDVNNLALQRVASGPVSGQYAVAAGVYTFAAADSGKQVFIDYNYTAVSTVAQKLALSNPVMGQQPQFQLDVRIPYNGNDTVFTFKSCVATKFDIATKLDDFTYPEFDLAVQAPGAAAVGEISWSQ